MADNNGANTAIITIVAIVAILIVGYVAMQMLGNAGDDSGANIDITLPTTSGETGGAAE